MSEYLGDLHYCRLPNCEVEGFRLRLARDEHELGHPELCRNPLCRATADNCLNRISDCCTACTHRRAHVMQPLERGHEPFCRSRLDVGLGHVVTCAGPSGHDGPHRVGHYSWDGELAALELRFAMEGRLQAQPLQSEWPDAGIVTHFSHPDPEAVERGRQAVKRLVAEADEEARERAIAEGRASRVRYGGRDVGTAWVDDGRIELHVSPATARQLGLYVEPGSPSMPPPIAEGPGNNEFHEVGALERDPLGRSYEANGEEPWGEPEQEPLAHYQVLSSGEVEQRLCTQTQGCMLPPHRGPCSEQARFRVSGENGL